MDFSMNINGHTLEYFDDGHVYLVDGIVTKSITQALSWKFHHKYDAVDEFVLERAAKKGTETHRAIEQYCMTGEMVDLPEVRNFKFLQKQYGFEAVENETPVILFFGDLPVMAGRLDMVIRQDGFKGLGIADIKRTASLDKEYLGYQLNLYRLAYQQSYGKEIRFLRGIHLRGDTRKFVQIPINEEMTREFVIDYLDHSTSEMKGVDDLSIRRF